MLDDPREDHLINWATYGAVRAELGGSFLRILGYFREDGEKAVAKIEAAMHGRDSAAMIIPAHTMKSEARQFGAIPLGMLAEEIEVAARRGVETQMFPDEILPHVARLRPLYETTIAMLEQRASPVQQRRAVFGRRSQIL